MKRRRGTPRQLRDGEIDLRGFGRPLDEGNPRISKEDSRVTGLVSQAGVFAYEGGLLEVLPKGFDSFGESTGDQLDLDFWNALIKRVLEVDSQRTITALDQELSELQGPRERLRPQCVIDIFLAVLLYRIQAALRRHRPPFFKRETLESQAIRGRIDFAKQVVRMAGLAHRHVINATMADDATKLYNFLRSGTRMLMRSSRHLISDNNLNRLAHEIDGELVGAKANADLLSLRGYIHDFVRHTPTRLAHFKEPVVQLAKWVFGLKSDQDELLAMTIGGFTINLDKTFERWTRKCVHQSLHLDPEINSSDAEELWAWGDPPRILKPDICVFDRRKNDGEPLLVRAVLDAKYKEFKLELLDEDNPPELEAIGRSDLYQMMAYRGAVVGRRIVKRPDNTQVRSSKAGSSWPRLLILYPGEGLKSNFTFVGDEGTSTNQWTLKMVEVPFVAYLKGEAMSAIDARHLLFGEN